MILVSTNGTERIESLRRLAHQDTCVIFARIKFVFTDYRQHPPVKLLDAIDFNPLFCNIDILSDFAMLVIDVWARTWSATLAHRMIDNYLQLTHQDDMLPRPYLNSIL
jgi:hypothetical protein